MKRKSSKTKFFYVASKGGWFVVEAEKKGQAARAGQKEFGKGHVAEVREATIQEVRYYKGLRTTIERVY